MSAYAKASADKSCIHSIDLSICLLGKNVKEDETSWSRQSLLARDSAAVVNYTTASESSRRETLTRPRGIFRWGLGIVSNKKGHS